MVTTRRTPRRYFNPEDADRMLPLVRVIVRDLMEAHRVLSGRIDAYEKAVQATRLDPAAPGKLDVDAVGREIEGLHGRFRTVLRELDQLGVLCRDPARGLVEFPSLLKTITWEPGEERVRVE